MSSFKASGTYGVAQMPSAHHLSDEESIDRLCASLAGYTVPRDLSGRVDFQRLEAMIEEHNPNSQFIEQVGYLYSEIRPDPNYAAEMLAEDGRSTIEVYAINRNRHTWVVKGTAFSGRRTLTVKEIAADLIERTSSLDMTGPTGLRREWEYVAKLQATQVEIYLDVTPDQVDQMSIEDMNEEISGGRGLNLTL